MKLGDGPRREKKQEKRGGGDTNYTNNIKTLQLPDGWVIKNQPMSANNNEVRLCEASRLNFDTGELQSVSLPTWALNLSAHLSSSLFKRPLPFANCFNFPSPQRLNSGKRPHTMPLLFSDRNIRRTKKKNKNKKKKREREKVRPFAPALLEHFCAQIVNGLREMWTLNKRMWERIGRLRGGDDATPWFPSDIENGGVGGGGDGRWGGTHKP